MWWCHMRKRLLQEQSLSKWRKMHRNMWAHERSVQLLLFRKFFGRHCEFERKSCQAYKAAGERSSGLYTIIDDSNQSFQVLCDFESEPGFAWNLIQSFSLSNKDCFKVSSVRFTEDVFHSPNWAYDWKWPIKVKRSSRILLSGCGLY